MKKLFLVLGIVFTMLLPITCDSKAGQFDVQTDSKWTFKVWCRHDAVYWGSIVGEAHQVRMVLGWYEDGIYKGWHVQPQIKVGSTWHYFRMEERFDQKEQMNVVDLKFISMPKRPEHKWRMAYTLTWSQFAIMHNSWMLFDKGKAFNSNSYWHKEMNVMMEKLKKLEEQYREDSSNR